MDQLRKIVMMNKIYFSFNFLHLYFPLCWCWCVLQVFKPCENIWSFSFSQVAQACSSETHFTSCLLVSVVSPMTPSMIERRHHFLADSERRVLRQVSPTFPLNFFLAFFALVLRDTARLLQYAFFFMKKHLCNSLRKEE